MKELEKLLELFQINRIESGKKHMNALDRVFMRPVTVLFFILSIYGCGSNSFEEFYSDVPDIEVKPTVQSIREGRDEFLEKVVEIIKNCYL
jgi:hypothetical protein